MSQRVVRRALLFLLALVMAVPSGAQTNDVVIVENDKARVTMGDFETDILRIPAELRQEVLANPKRLTELIYGLLVSKTLAVEAREIGLDKDPIVRRRVELEATKTLASIRVEKFDADSAAEFESKSAQFEQRARELYLVNRERYRSPEMVSASHILFRTDSRPKEEALKLAEAARTRLLAGEDFGKVAMELSEDPTARRNAGHLGYFSRDRMDPAFATAAFALKNVGDISEPVLSAFGYHLIQLEGRRSERTRDFEEMKDGLMLEEKKQYVEARRKALIESIRNDPALEVNQSAVDALRPQASSPAPSK